MKILDKLKRSNIQQNSRQILQRILNDVMVKKDKERLRNCNKLLEIKVTQNFELYSFNKFSSMKTFLQLIIFYIITIIEKEKTSFEVIVLNILLR